MKRLAAYKARWEDRTLHLRINPDDWIFVYPDHLVVREQTVLPGQVGKILVAQRSKDDGPFQALAIQGAAVLTLEDPDEAMELARVLQCWRDDPAVREAWGTLALDACLVPELDEAARKRLGAEPTPDGLVVPVSAPLGRGTSLGCYAYFAMMPLFFVAMYLGVESWEASGRSHHGTVTDFTYVQLWLFIAILVLPAGIGVLNRASRTPTDHRLIVSQQGLALPDGRFMPFHQLQRARAIRAYGIELSFDSDDPCTLYGIRGDMAPALAAALDHRRVADNLADAPAMLRAVVRDRELP